MAKVSFPERLTPLSIALGGAATAALLLAAGLVKATLNECRATIALDEALRARGCGRFDVAGEAAQRARDAKRTRCAPPRLLLALQRHEAGDRPAAKEAYESLLADDKTPLASRERALCLDALGVLALLEGRPPAGKPWTGPQVEKARDLLRESAEAWPEFPEPLLNLAALELLAGRPDAARGLLSKADESALPPSLEATRLRGQLREALAVREGKPAAALDEVRCLRTLRPSGQPERLSEALALTRVAAASGDRAAAEAAQDLLNGLDLRGVDPALVSHVRARLALLEIELLGTFAPVPPGQGMTKAEELCRRRLDRLLGEVGPEGAFLGAVRVSRELAREGVTPGAARGAVETLRAGAAAPDAPAVLAANLGVALAAAGKPAEALPLLQKAAEAAPADPQAALNLAAALDLSGDRAAALRWYDRSLSLKPGQPAAQARSQALRKGGP